MSRSGAGSAADWDALKYHPHLREPCSSRLLSVVDIALADQASGRRLAAGCPWLMPTKTGNLFRLHIPLHEIASWSTQENTAVLLPPAHEIIVDWPEGTHREIRPFSPFLGARPRPVTVSWPGLCHAAAMSEYASIYRDEGLLNALAPVLEGIANDADASSVMTSDLQTRIYQHLGGDILIDQYRNYDHRIAQLL